MTKTVKTLNSTTTLTINASFSVHGVQKKRPQTKQFYFVVKNSQAVRLIKRIARKTLSGNSQLKR